MSEGWWESGPTSVPESSSEKILTNHLDSTLRYGKCFLDGQEANRLSIIWPEQTEKGHNDCQFARLEFSVTAGSVLRVNKGPPLCRQSLCRHCSQAELKVSVSPVVR